MNSEKQNNMPAWNENFLAWEQNGGKELSTQDLLWEKLHSRLQPNRKKVAFYFLRVAILLVIASCAFLFLYKKNPPKIKTTITNTVITNKAIGSPVEKTFPVITGNISPVAVKKESIHNNITPADNKVPSIRAIIIQPAGTAPVVEQLAAVEQLNIIKDSAKQVVTGPVGPPKRLRVVHMNEWYAPPPPDYATLKDHWEPKQEQQTPVEQTNGEPYSIWPGRNKNKLSVSLGD